VISVRGWRPLASAAAAVTLLATAAAAPSEPVTTRQAVDVEAVIDVGGVPSGIVATADGIWVATGPGGIVRIEPRTNSVTVRIRPGGAVIGLAAGFGDLWAIDAVGNRLLRIDPRQRRVSAVLPVGPMPTGLAVGCGRVWVVSQLGSTVVGIDPRTSRVQAARRFTYGELWPGGVATGPDGVWLVTGQGTEVTRLDGGTAAVESTFRVPGARTLAATRHSVWVGRSGDRPLARIEQDGLHFVPFARGHGANGRGPALVAGRSVWVADRGRLAAYDPAGTNELALPLPTSGHVGAVAVAGDVWLADESAGAVVRVRAR